MNVALPLAYQDLEPAPVWSAFALLNSTPRPSGQEERLRRKIEEIAQSKGALTRTDERGNLVVALPGKNSTPGAPTVAIQAHLDMVCQKRPEVAFNFESDAIQPQRDGDKISATGTTLGADNGIGVAYMLAILDGAAEVHPPLELLFTVEEETGLYGAALLDPDIVSARRLINLDSEEDDEITIGCAGGAGVSLFLPIEREARHENESAYRITVGGLAGGHSGIQIGEPLGNAIKIAGQLLDALHASVPTLRLSSFEGGTAHNAIPRDCHVAFATPAAWDGALSTAWAHIANEIEVKWEDDEPNLVLSLEEAVANEIEVKWEDDEPNLVLSLEEAVAVEAPLTTNSTEKVLELVRALPHGVQKMSDRWAHKVQTSSNLAEIKTEEGEVSFHVSNRSFVACDIADMQEHCATLGKNAGARVEARDGYPGWEPRAESPLRDQTAAAFANVNGNLPRIEVVHAGLECGLLSEKLPGLDAVSFGPTIRGAHTPEEWVSIASVTRNWNILKELLTTLAS